MPIKTDMTINYIFFIFLGAGCFAHVQKKMPPPPPSEYEFIDHIQKDFTKFSLSKRLASYPFKKAARIKIVSFNLDFDFKDRDSPPDSSGKMKEEVQMSRVMKRNDCSKMNQIKELNMDQIATLSDILFNTCARHSVAEYDQMGCYYPRNAILFLDKSNNIFEYFEVCFDCRGIETNKKFPLLDENICGFMYEDLEKYFNMLGIETKSHN